MEGLKPYPTYKESGLPWLGQVPAHWATSPGFAAFREKQIKNIGMREKRVLSLSYGRIVVKPEGQRGLMPDSFETYQIVDPGDIIIRSTDLQNDKTSLRIGYVRDRGIITSAYICMKASDAILPAFGYQLLNAYDLSKVLYGMGSGLRQNLAWADFKRMVVFLPPREEQAAIVRFLDHATHQVDKTIRAKRKIIALLNEQKQAIIHRAVTRGLDPDVPLKDSGIPWLGQIPAHWEAAPLKGLCSIQSGITLGKFYEGEQLRDFPYLRVANVQAGHLALKTVKSLRLPLSEAKRATLQIGDVLMTEGGDPDKLGRGCVWNGEIANCLHQNHVFAVRPNCIRLRSYFLAGLLESSYARNYFQQTSKQTTNLASTNKTTIGRFRVPLPSINEQDAILEALEAKLHPVAATIGRIEREISLLREYRTRLIVDVVTGKLDVCEAAARLPELASETAEELDSVEADETLDHLTEEAA
jgi:type I restriction enzyme S subunit